MTTVLAHLCTSLDGFVANLDDDPAELFDWYWAGDVVIPSAMESLQFSVDAASASVLGELISGCGAMIVGRRLFDLTNGWNDRHPSGAPVVVVTHRDPSPEVRERFPRTTFVGEVEQAVQPAKAIARSQFVTIASADILRQALDRGLVDELWLSVVPVLFGTGVRCFGELVGGHVVLDNPRVVQGDRALHLRYRVRR